MAASEFSLGAAHDNPGGWSLAWPHSLPTLQLLCGERRLDPLNGPNPHTMRRRELHDAGLAQAQIGADRSFLLGLDWWPP